MQQMGRVFPFWSDHQKSFPHEFKPAMNAKLAEERDFNSRPL
jgi:hypothetical protein